MEIPEGYKNGDIFSITSVDAFRDLPWETAATYGGTSFKIIDLENGIIEVQDQKYHYNMHKNNSVKNILRNIATNIGYPTTMELYNGKFKAYNFKYYNRTIQLK